MSENQQALEESIEKMGVWMTKHPSGTLLVQQGDEQVRIFPHENRWTYQIFQGRQSLAYQSGFFARKDVALFVHKILTWSWDNGANKYS